MTKEPQPPALQVVMKEARRAVKPLIWFSAGINVLMLTGALYMLQVYHRVLSSHSLETLVMLSLMAAGALVANGGAGGGAGTFAGHRRRVDERAAGPGSVDGIRRTRRRCPRSDQRATTARPRPSAEFLHQPEHLPDPRRAVGTTFLRRHLPHAPVAGLVGAGRRGRVVRVGAAQRVRHPQAAG